MFSVVHASTKAGLIQCLTGLHSEFQVSEGYTVSSKCTMLEHRVTESTGLNLLLCDFRLKNLL